MSQRQGHGGRGSALWLIRPVRALSGTLFYGTLIEVVARINDLHCRSGVQHAAREIGG